MSPENAGERRKGRPRPITRGNRRSSLHGSAGQQSGITERALCVEPHEYGPVLVAEWEAWADTRAATHTVEACPDCGLHVVWRPITEPTPEQPEPGLFDLPENDSP